MSAIASFDLWMSKGTYDIFALVIKFLNENWQPKKVTINLFEACQALTINLKKLLDSYGLRKKIIVYVKDEGANLTMTTSFKFIVNCEVLGLEENFNDTCFGHAFSKTYLTAKERLCKNLKFVSIKFT
jgi:hypothetical protein